MKSNGKQQSDKLQFNVPVSEMRELKRWSRGLGIVGLIVSSILVIVSIFGGSILRNLEQASLTGGNRSFVFVIILLLLAAALFSLSVLVMMFSKSINLKKERENDPEKTFRYLAYFFRLAVIFTVIFVLLIVMQLAVGIF